jgi:hypothetical protein
METWTDKSTGIKYDLVLKHKNFVVLSKIDDIKKLHNKIDNFKSLRGKVEKRTTRKHIKYRLLNLQKKVSDVVDNLHNQSACMLTNKFENIILPPRRCWKRIRCIHQRKG